MFSEDTSDQPTKEAGHNKDWVINFLNLPHPEQIDFLYRHAIDEKLRKQIENKVFGE